jgi:hypothetical protein
LFYAAYAPHNEMESTMTEEEIEAVAEELAKVGGSSWYPGRTTGPLFRTVSDRYRDRARVAIAALDRLRANKKRLETPESQNAQSDVPDDVLVSRSGDPLHVGSIVIYRPSGERRAVPCRVEKLADGRAYLVHCAQPDIGWVSIEGLVSLDATDSVESE